MSYYQQYYKKNKDEIKRKHKEKKERLKKTDPEKYHELYVEPVIRYWRKNKTKIALKRKIRNVKKKLEKTLIPLLKSRMYENILCLKCNRVKLRLTNKPCFDCVKYWDSNQSELCGHCEELMTYMKNISKQIYCFDCYELSGYGSSSDDNE